MALRFVEVTVSNRESAGSALAAAVEAATLVDSWDGGGGDRICRRVLLEARDAEALVDRLSGLYGGDPGFRVVLLPVEATLPAPPEDADDSQAAPDRVAREELRADLTEASRPSRLFFVQVVLSTLVAAVGLTTDNVAVVIGAMVIAPLLGPNVALAFGATIGDVRFIRRALGANVSGMALAFVLAIGVGATIEVDPTVPSIASRTTATVADIVLALSSGVAGTLAMTAGVAASLIGVMVAVALLPPAAVAGLLVGSGHVEMAMGAGLLVAVNVICVNLAGVATFAAQGVRPRGWWEQDGARRSSRLALLLWTGLLTLMLIALLWPRG